MPFYVVSLGNAMVNLNLVTKWCDKMDGFAEFWGEGGGRTHKPLFNSLIKLSLEREV